MGRRLVRRYVASKSDITPKAREQYSWAIPHIEQGLGAIPLARLIATMSPTGSTHWRAPAPCLDEVCRSVGTCSAPSLADAVEEGLIPTTWPPCGVALPRTVAKPVKERVVQAWEATDVQTFLAAVAEHRWAVGFQLGVLYGLRRSEVLALRWDDFYSKGRTLRIDESLVAVNRGAVLGDPKNVRSRRLVPLSDDGVRALKPTPNRASRRTTSRRCGLGRQRPHHRHPPGSTRTPPFRSTDRWRSSSTRPSCHASPHMVCVTPLPLTWSTTRRYVGELRAIADILGHSPEMLMTVYAHASHRAVKRSLIAFSPLRRSRYVQRPVPPLLSYNWSVTVTLDLPADAQARLQAEALRRGITVDKLVADLADPLPAEDPLEAFIGSGSSGRGDLARRHREIRSEQTASLPARYPADGSRRRHRRATGRR